MSLLPTQITRVIEELSKLPGLGPKSAERLTFHMLRSSRASPEALGKSLVELKTDLQYCNNCQMITITDTCAICSDDARDHETVLVVEEPLEVIAFERTPYRGIYHVLHGVLSPIDGLGPEQLKIRELIARVKKGGIKEVILATDPDIEGEATASYLQEQLKDLIPIITRLAHGLPMGADIEFADRITLQEAIAGRRGM